MNRQDKELIAAVRDRSPDRPRASTVFGDEFNRAVKLYKAGFLGWGQDAHANDIFWFITDDPAGASTHEAPSPTSLQTVILRKDIPQKSGPPANLFMLRVPRFESNKLFQRRLRWALAKLGLKYADIVELEAANDSGWKSGSVDASRFTLIDACGLPVG